MKAYKASYNGVCRDFKYEVGMTYETDEIIICRRGFHACLNMANTLLYYKYNKYFVLFEVELLGKIIKDNDKVVTDKIKIVRVVPPEEYVDFKVDDKGNIIYENSCGIEYWNEYDLNKNCIYQKTSDGYECWNEFDERNNCIHYKDSDGTEWWREYDLNNNCIHRKHSNGSESWREFDSKNNCIHYKNNDGVEKWNKYD